MAVVATAATTTAGHGSMATFNLNHGYLEGILRGFRSGILTTSDYTNLTQCDNLDDMKMHLQSTDYGDFLANEPSPLHTTTIADQATNKLVREFVHIRGQCVEPLSTFLDYMSYQYMIDNIVLLITGTLHGSDIDDLIERCHPLGMFPNMQTLSVARTPKEAYNYCIVETPLAAYFVRRDNPINHDDLNEVNVEIIRNTLYKHYLEDFYRFCMTLGGDTANFMKDILQFEADRRAITLTLNSFGTELMRDDREKLYPQVGLLAPEGLRALADCQDMEQVSSAMDPYVYYKPMFAELAYSKEKSLEDMFFEREVHLNKMSFESAMHYGIFYSYLKLKEQEIRNVVWIAECLAQNQKAHVNRYVSIFPRKSQPDG